MQKNDKMAGDVSWLCTQCYKGRSSWNGIEEPQLGVGAEDDRVAAYRPRGGGVWGGVRSVPSQVGEVWGGAIAPPQILSSIFFR